MVQVTVSWGGKFESTETDVVQSLVINTVRLICVLNQLMDREGSIVGLNNSVTHLANKII